MEFDYAATDGPLSSLGRRYRSGYLIAPQDGFGKLWMHQYQRRLDLQLRQSGYPMISALRQNGEIVRFTAVSGTWLAMDGQPDSIVPILDASRAIQGWQYKDNKNDLIENYDSTGKLISVQERNGGTTTLVYSDNSTPRAIAPRANLLIRVTSSFGRSIQFTYDANARIASMVSPDQKVSQYAYNANGMLASVTWPDGKSRTYHYEDSRFAWALTGITDEAGVRFASYSYDDQGRATGTEHASGADKVQLQFLGQRQTVVTSADGSSRSLAFELVNNVLRPTTASASCPECGSIAQRTTYDASGNVSSRVDFNNRETRYTYDSSGRETQRIEGYGASDAQTTTTQWHPTWRLPIKVAAPGRVDYFSYDDKGQLIGYAWFPTSDANGSQGVNAQPAGAVTSSGWTYDASGRVTAAVEMSGDTVTGQWYFTYDANGNLQTLTDRDGKVGQAIQYDAAGRLLDAINTDGERLRYQYNARGSLTAYEVNGVVSSYEYDANGFLTAVRGPGSYYEGYEYDAAHRLVARLASAAPSQASDLSSPFGALSGNRPAQADSGVVQSALSNLWTWLKGWVASWIPSANAQAGLLRIPVPSWPSKSQAPTNAPSSPAEELQDGAGLRQNPSALLQQFDRSLRELANRLTEPMACDEDPRCTRARSEAQSAYHELTTKRLPQYLSGGTGGSDEKHRNAILQKQTRLKDAIRRVKLYCIAWPLELPEWERVANMDVPILY
ncbi:RHS repeat protein [Cupriavidus malaysiensis]|uniref:RHS repeat protein n=1 Tax=Cupriavidus malaysiensis TaxID=367825 RepID=UPI00138FAEA1|nr:RHS repeat protein [Cupriavidus malaysiensis]